MSKKAKGPTREITVENWSEQKHRRLQFYGVKQILRWFFKKGKKTRCFEERVVIVRAHSFKEAIEIAEVEAKEYCRNDPKANFRIEPTGYYDAFWMFDERITHLTEAYSNLSDSNLTTASFMKRRFPKEW